MPVTTLKTWSCKIWTQITGYWKIVWPNWLVWIRVTWPIKKGEERSGETKPNQGGETPDLTGSWELCGYLANWWDMKSCLYRKFCMRSYQLECDFPVGEKHRATAQTALSNDPSPHCLSLLGWGGRWWNGHWSEIYGMLTHTFCDPWPE